MRKRRNKGSFKSLCVIVRKEFLFIELRKIG